MARVGHLGQAARECVGRRRVAMAEGVRMRQEAAAYQAAHIRGRGRWGAARAPGNLSWEAQFVKKKKEEKKTLAGSLSGPSQNHGLISPT